MGWSRFTSPRTTILRLASLLAFGLSGPRSCCSNLRIRCPSARSEPRPRKSVQPKPPPRSPVLRSIPRLTLRFSAGGPLMLKPRNRPPIVPPTPPVFPRPLDPAPAQSSSYCPSTRMTMPGQKNALSFPCIDCACCKSSVMLPEGSFNASMPVGAMSSIPRSRCWLPPRPSKLAIGVIL